jgi:hypothetical protein
MAQAVGAAANSGSGRVSVSMPPLLSGNTGLTTLPLSRMALASAWSGLAAAERAFCQGNVQPHGLGGLQLADQVGVQFAWPGPVAHFRQAAIVHFNQDGVVRRLLSGRWLIATS